MQAGNKHNPTSCTFFATRDTHICFPITECQHLNCLWTDEDPSQNPVESPQQQKTADIFQNCAFLTEISLKQITAFFFLKKLHLKKYLILEEFDSKDTFCVPSGIWSLFYAGMGTDLKEKLKLGRWGGGHLISNSLSLYPAAS